MHLAFFLLEHLAEAVIQSNIVCTLQKANIHASQVALNPCWSLCYQMWHILLVYFYAQNMLSR